MAAVPPLAGAETRYFRYQSVTKGGEALVIYEMSQCHL